MAELTKEKKVNGSKIIVRKDDISKMDVDAFVYYADETLALGTGDGNAINLRGGPKIQEELNKLGKQPACSAVVSAAGNLKAKHIIHAVGPKFQEADTEDKLRRTTENALKRAEELGLRRIAFPAMGCGFYGIPLDVSARVTLGAIEKHLQGSTKLAEVIVVARDKREFLPFSGRLGASS
jgi:O-acetyl-ADP-ribose deacetylase (regulator of RNase III)